MKIEITEKSGFHTTDKFLRIYDGQGRLFYFFDMKPGRHDLHFNLPPGVYTTNNNVRRGSVRKYKLPSLPKKERSYTPPRELKISYANNPNKATIDVTRGTVVLDYSIQNLSRPQKVYILYHEKGHHFYATEHYCDLYAMRQMLRDGFNPSQIARSIAGALGNTHLSNERKDFIVGHCEKTFK